MDTEPPSDFRSIFAKFEDASFPKSPTSPTPAPIISKVQSNPALAGVISTLLNHPKPFPPPINKKPELPAKPSPAVIQRKSAGNKPPVPLKEKLSTTKQDMRLNKGLRHTLHIGDSQQSDGDGVCSQSPQVYRQSWSAALDSNPYPVADTNGSDSQECYEVIDDSFKTKEKPPIPLKAHRQPQTSKQKPPQVLETNMSNNADCYQDVDNVKPQAKSQLPYLAHLKKVLAKVEEKPSPTMKAGQSDGEDCYEFIDDSVKTPVMPPFAFTDRSSFVEALTEPETSYSDGEECYEEVDPTFHALEENRPTYNGNSEPRASCADAKPSNIPEMNDFHGQEQYESVSIFDLQIEPPPPFNDPPPVSQNNLSPITTKTKPLRSVEATSSDLQPNQEDKPPRTPDAKIKPMKNIPVSSTPRTNPLPSRESLGRPPLKEPRPPQVDLTPYWPAAVPCTVVLEAPKREDAEMMKPEPPAPSSAAPDEDYYDDTDLSASQQENPNLYEVDEPLPETLRVPEYKPSISSLSPEGGRRFYEDTLELQEPAADANAYEVEESVQEPPGENSYEVTKENPNSWASSVQNGSHRGLQSFVSEDYYSTGDLDPDRGTLQREEKLSKSEQAFRKKFKITGLEDPLYTTTIILDFKPEKYTLPLKKGDAVDVLRITDCPPGKWLVKDNQGNHGFVPVSCVDVSKDILTFSNQHHLMTSGTSDIYSDLDRAHDSGMGTDQSISDSYSGRSDDTYDDVESKISTPTNSVGKSKGFGNLFRKDKNKKEELGSPYITVNPHVPLAESGENYNNGASESNARDRDEKTSTIFRSLFNKGKEQKGKTDTLKNEGKGNTQVSTKKLAKEEKLFREKFKYTGEINVYSIGTIISSVPLSSKDKMALPVKPGDIVDVIDVTNEDQIICRNSEGKYGFVQIEHLNLMPSH